MLVGLGASLGKGVQLLLDRLEKLHRRGGVVRRGRRLPIGLDVQPHLLRVVRVAVPVGEHRLAARRKGCLLYT